MEGERGRFPPDPFDDLQDVGVVFGLDVTQPSGAGGRGRRGPRQALPDPVDEGDVDVRVGRPDEERRRLGEGMEALVCAVQGFGHAQGRLAAPLVEAPGERKHSHTHREAEEKGSPLPVYRHYRRRGDDAQLEQPVPLTDGIRTSVRLGIRHRTGRHHDRIGPSGSGNSEFDGGLGVATGCHAVQQDGQAHSHENDAGGLQLARPRDRGREHHGQARLGPIGGLVAAQNEWLADHHIPPRNGSLDRVAA